MDAVALASLEKEKRECEHQLEVVETQIANGAGDLEDLNGLKIEIGDMIKQVSEAIAEIKATAAPTPAPLAEKRDNKNVATKATTTATPEPEAAPIRYNVNDSVQAKWISGDKAFYPARITSVTGSSTDPVYTVKFKSYHTVETLRSKDIRPAGGNNKDGGGNASTTTGNNTSTAGTKRKAEGPAETGNFSPVPGASATPGGANSGLVVQAGPEKYEQRPANNENEKPKKKPKIKSNKELEANQKTWADFTQKNLKHGKGLAGVKKKESMFRTPDNPNGRVGFTGSGQTMRKDVVRTRHVYQTTNEDDD